MRTLLLALGALLLLAPSALAQRDKAAFGEGFSAQVIRVVEEHPAAVVIVTGAAGLAAALALKNRKKGDDDNG